MDILAKISNLVKNRRKDIFLGLCLLLISVICYNLGRTNALNKAEIETGEMANINRPTTRTSTAKATSAQPKDLRVVVSKASTSKKYHYSWCSGAQRIKEANKLWFNNESLAQQAGYALAGNCQ